MVAKIIHSKSIRAILSYNEIKVKSCEAELLMAAGFPVAPEQLSFNGKLERFLMLTRQNERTHTNAMHVILSFSAEDKLDNDMLQSIAFQYMDGIGFGGQPFLLYRHYDTHNPHVHIATVNIAPGGQRIETHNIGRDQSEKARKMLEEIYGLVKAEDQKKEEQFLIRPADINVAVHGKSKVKATVSDIVRQVTTTYKFASLPELNAVLRQFNVMAYRGPEGSRMHEKGGLVYCVLDGQGQPVSMPIKASSIFSSPTLKNLERKYGPNQSERKPYVLRLKHQLDKAVTAAGDLGHFQQLLQKQGIRILLRLNAQGNLYGATFIDNSTRVVVNGSELGKPYGAKGFMERLSAKGFSLDMITAGGTRGAPDIEEEDSPVSEKKQGKYPAGGRPVIEVMQDDSRTEGPEAITAGPYKQRRSGLGLG